MTCTERTVNSFCCPSASLPVSPYPVRPTVGRREVGGNPGCHLTEFHTYFLPAFVRPTVVPIQLVKWIDDASRPAGASRKHDTCQLHAMALGLAGQTIEPAEGYKKNATASADAKAAAVECG